jgi:serine/threonine protein kinase
MAGQVIERDKLGVLTRIGQGGQGVVYRAPNVKTKFAASMVYKEYKPPTRAAIDFTALAAMPALVEDSLSYAEAERLVSMAAWPCALVEENGSTTGFVMPAIPEEFFVELRTAKGVSSSTAEFQHLLNHATVLAARGIDLDDAQRYSLLREVASGLAFLHKHGVTVGDISPKNLLFTLAPHPGIFFIDCDAMRINTISALPQMETPGWDVPSGEELATIYTDAYKLALLALRLLAGDQDTKNPQHLPPTTPSLLRQIITDTLHNPPERRPLPEAWTYVLGHAIEEAQHRDKTTTAAATVALEPPPTPVVHTRPTERATRSRPPAAAAQSGPISAPLPPPPAKTNLWPVAILGAAVVIAIIVAVILVGALNNTTNTNNSAASASATSSATAAYPSYSYSASPPSWTPPAVSVPPPMVQTPDSYGVSCPDGYQLPNQTGWATRAGRGTDQTSCRFVDNVLHAYWNTYSTPGRDSRQVLVGGTRPCPEIRAVAPGNVQCSGNDFVMTCAVEGNDPWITCTGGNNARIYLY